MFKWFDWGSWQPDAGQTELPRILRVRRQPQDVLLLGPPRGVRLHWRCDRTWPCTGAGCTYCGPDDSGEIKWYFPAQTMRVNPEGDRILVLAVLELPDPAVGPLRGWEGPLRGLVVRVEPVHQDRANKRGRVLRYDVRVRGPAPDGAVVPPAFDVELSLRRVWRGRPQLLRLDQQRWRQA